MVLSLDERFMSKVERHPSGCWLWTGYVDPKGYARFNTPGEIRAHRFAYGRWMGPIPTGLVIDHLCRVRSCVNPDHLRVLTSRENTFAVGSIAPAKTLKERAVCVHGHIFTEGNTRYENGRRRCRDCVREKVRAKALEPKSPTCPHGHERRRDRAGRMYCPECHRATRVRPRTEPTHFACGHLRSETGAPTRAGTLYCTNCRVERRVHSTCRRGHNLNDQANVYFWRGRRFCKPCIRIRQGRSS